MTKTFLELDQVNPYRIASDLSDHVWDIVSRWEWLSKRTIGIQYINSTDSIAANIAEGFGRYHKKDKQKFFFNARGSLYEALHWTKKARAREILSEKEFLEIMNILSALPKEINWLIRITEEKLKE